MSWESRSGTGSPRGRKDKLEEGFEEGASIQIKLSTGETVPAEVRVFKILRQATTPTTTLRRLVCAR